MKRIGAIFAGEVAEKWLLFPGAFVIGAFPFVLSRVRPGGMPPDVRGAAAVFLAGLTGGALAVAFGFRSTAGDLARGRAAFYFARPVTAAALWLGKLLGSLFVVFGSTALVLLPAILAGDGPFRGWALVPTTPTFDAILPEGVGPAGTCLAATAALVLLYLLSQAAGVASLARSPRLLAEAAAIGAGVLLVGATFERLRLARADVPAAGALLAVAAVLATGLAVGCYRAVKEGGTDPSRAERAQARIFAAAIAASVGGVLAFGVWVLRPSPGDLRTVDWVAPAPRGDWFGVLGHARGHDPAFLVNARTGEFLRLAPAGQRPPVFSADGRAAAWSASMPGFPESTVIPRTVSLADPRHPRVAWETKNLHAEPLLVFSPSGRRFAVIEPGRIVVWNAAGGGLLSAATPPRALWEYARGATGATFAGEDRLRIFAVRPGGASTTDLEILDFDLAAKRLTTTGRAGPFRGTFPILASPDRSRLLVREATAAVDLLDGETGRTLAKFGAADASFRSAAFLSDGTIALFESSRGAGRLCRLTPDGAVTSTLAVGPADRAWILGEPRAGDVMLAVSSGSGAARRHVIVVDRTTGRAESWGEDLLPASPFAATLSGDPGAAPAPGSLAARLFFTVDRTLVALDGPGRVRRLFPRP